MIFVSKKPLNKVLCALALVMVIGLIGACKKDASAEDKLTVIQADIDIPVKCQKEKTLDAFSCLKEEVAKLDSELDSIIASVILDLHSPEGAEANTEISERMQLSQESWRKYRDLFCLDDYYTKAAVHPPSQSYRIQRCRYKKSYERLIELKNKYNKGE
ncbi:MAG: DUF1311 domain-containing protein [Micavibrio aeruginosavorus]|uniref:DUF1311 domain-containing protein n=1 Tax=Micavibrio aeruginosavorus TaxID=349221 RepID=A0A7T5R3C5_9BACT|nr:MAG: DUF1311 domain-containing protein [Micavibrio aeruginosavorus]